MSMSSINSGTVPFLYHQVSVLGPQFFIVYINDICNASDILKFILFADDTSVFCADSDITRLVKLLTQTKHWTN